MRLLSAGLLFLLIAALIATIWIAVGALLIWLLNLLVSREIISLTVTHSFALGGLFCILFRPHWCPAND